MDGRPRARYIRLVTFYGHYCLYRLHRAKRFGERTGYPDRRRLGQRRTNISPRRAPQKNRLRVLSCRGFRAVPDDIFRSLNNSARDR